MADSACTSGKMALIPCIPKKKLQSNNLCDDLAAEILLRLPTKSAVGFKVVCKRWYSLISSPYFISRFIHIRHHRRDFQSSFVFEYRYNCDRACKSGFCTRYHYDLEIISDCSLLRNLYGEERVFSLSYLPCPPEHLQLVGSFADLILCSYHTTRTKETNYYVSNLLTKQWISLPPPPSFHNYFSIGFLCVPPSCSECNQVDSSPHHKFMVVGLSYLPVSSLAQFEVQVFSSEDGKWTTLVVSYSLRLETHEVESSLVAYRGMLHWINTNRIVVYDPLNTPKTISRIIHLPFPFRLFPFVHIESYIGVSQGCLRAVEVSAHEDDDTVYPIMDVWELEDYDSGLWNLVYKVDLTNLIGLTESLHIELGCTCVLSLHPEKGDVIYLRIRNGAVLLNMKSRIVERYYLVNKNEMLFGCVNAAFHLVDQWWPTPLSSLH